MRVSPNLIRPLKPSANVGWEIVPLISYYFSAYAKDYSIRLPSPLSKVLNHCLTKGLNSVPGLRWVLRCHNVHIRGLHRRWSDMQLPPSFIPRV